MTTAKDQQQARKFWVRRTTLGEAAGRSFDLEFWQAQSAEERLRVAAEMIEIVDAIKGRSGGAGERRVARERIVKFSRAQSDQDK